MFPSGNKSNEEEEDDDEDELLHLEESDTEAPCDEDLGPVLQVSSDWFIRDCILCV